MTAYKGVFPGVVDGEPDGLGEEEEEVGVSSSLNSDLNHTASLVAWVCPIYSASQVERATVGCLLELQLIAPLPMLKMKPEVERRVS